MGFKATEAVEELTYDFRPHVEAHGVIPEPTSKQIDRFRAAVVGSVRDSGLDIEGLQSGKVGFDQIDTIMEQSADVERSLLSATADVTGIAHSVLEQLPYRIKSAFLGWIAGMFLSPEA